MDEVRSRPEFSHRARATRSRSAGEQPQISDKNLGRVAGEMALEDLQDASLVLMVSS